MKRYLFGLIGLVGLIVGMVLVSRAPVVRGKFHGYERQESLIPADVQTAAVNVALLHPDVQTQIAGHRAKAFGVTAVTHQYADNHPTCTVATCHHVHLFDFDDGAGLAVVVEGDVVHDVWVQPHNRPLISNDLADLAMEIALNHPDVIAELGFVPEQVSMLPNDAGSIDTPCPDNQICVAATFEADGRNLWALINLTSETLVDTFWTQLRPVVAAVPERIKKQERVCPAAGNVERDGWTLSYETTNTDGLNTYNVSFNGVDVMTSAKVVEWHADYPPEPGGGFIDSTGCTSGFGFPIEPWEETEIVDLVDESGAIIGFEVAQDFRAPAWGENCAYRYEQRHQFYVDGRFNIASGAYGRGCGSGGDSDPVYAPVVRIDVAVAGDENDFFAIDGIQQPVEQWTQFVTGEMADWTITDLSGLGYAVRPRWGINTPVIPTPGAETGVDQYVYVTRHNDAEGELDFGPFTTTTICCNETHEQGPHEFVDGDVIDDSNIVLWVVPRIKSNSDETGSTCWTVQGDPDPITHPCFSSIEFVPLEPIPTAVTTTTISPNSPDLLNRPILLVSLIVLGVIVVVGITKSWIFAS